ncbi:hypothetical protein CAP35_14825 [Chitinophagaceae bacterium IBVUCB1]|nr:hypothetical protein CAP35_14825 [Chitinophagaceae bacterium IBVUCB1]
MCGLKSVWCAILVMCCYIADAQTPQFAFRIRLKDKQGSLPLSNPSAFLSQRAQDRRTALVIAIDSTDQPVSTIYLNDIATTIAYKQHLTSRWQNYVVILVTDSTNMPTVRSKPYVTGVDYVGYFPTGLHKVTSGNNENGLQKATGSQSYYGAAYEQTRVVNGDHLHDRGYKGKGKLIAVMDEGFAGVDTGPAFDSVMKSGRMVDRYNFVYANTDVYSTFNHGTGCLSTMAGNMPGTYVGSAPEASYAVYVTEYRFAELPIELDNIVAATERADSIGADVISASVGYNSFSPPFTSLVYADINGSKTVATIGANMATAKGILFVITAGNDGASSWKYILAPGDADSALTVGCVNNGKAPWSQSGFGPNSSGRIKPDVCAQGSPSAIMLSSASPTLGTGTSYSTPQLAGWAACLLQATTINPSPARIRNAIVQSAHAYSNPTGQLGYGVPDFAQAAALLNIKDTERVKDNSSWVQVYPNPANRQVQVALALMQSGAVQFLLTDANGRNVYNTERNLQTGKQTITLQVPELPKGIYQLTVTTNERKATQKVLMQ